MQGVEGTVENLMLKNLISARQHDTVATLRQLMQRNRVHAIPIRASTFDVLGTKKRGNSRSLGIF